MHDFDDFGIFDDECTMEDDEHHNSIDEPDDCSTDHYHEASQIKEEDMDEEDVPEDDEMSDADLHAAATSSIEHLVLSLLTQVSLLPASFKPCKVPKMELQLTDRRKSTADGSMGTRQLRFPEKAKPLSQLLRVLDLTHEALVCDIPTTKRDIYYRDVPLFQKQGVVDRLIDDLAATFELERSDLNVRASSKGLVCGGGLVMHLKSGEAIYANETEGALIPVGEDISSFEVGDNIAWVLVVEKEAVFQTLCRLNLAGHPSLPGPGIIITGKGYPDVATRNLVKTLSDNLPTHIPVMALVDGDAYGLDILSVYKHGSASLRHENAKLAAGRLEWIGVWASELVDLDIDRHMLIPINKYDEKKAHAMLRRDSSTMPPQWRNELQHMLDTRRKAEIEILSTIKVARAQNSECTAETGGEECAKGKGALQLLNYLLGKITRRLANADADLDCFA
ncbi:DNA topoisomerase IV, alpha subunit [Athelia psychrophila]|uniref:DNA topoisomerase (ATP-hydrolyzing) n=2 Tax=Athelia psychrophila TaxID=1759441 RepID=A0A166GLY4_9AGAM|nr:DNA topoisomerase IV, alpha subunit [Fibularhizoctonia sp. CBS 109695]